MKKSERVAVAAAILGTILLPTAADAYCVHRDTGAAEPSPDLFYENCCSGRPARWRAQDQPVPVYIWDQTPNRFIIPIYQAVHAWNEIPSCTFEMQIKGWSDHKWANDGEIVIGFDTSFCTNDPDCNPATDVPIAGTSAPTSGAGTDSFHIRNSTIVANAENLDWDTQANARMVMTHELGHVLGIMHPNDAPHTAGGHGCGEDFRGATMACCGGQLDAASLELDDVAAATALYPTWRYTVEVVDAAQFPIKDAAVYLHGTCFPHDGANAAEGGMVLGDIQTCMIGDAEPSNTYIEGPTYITGANGRTGAFRVLHPSFCIEVAKAGFKTAEGCQTLNEPGNYITTVELNLDITPPDDCSAMPGRSTAALAVVALLLLVVSRRRRTTPCSSNSERSTIS